MGKHLNKPCPKCGGPIGAGMQVVIIRPATDDIPQSGDTRRVKASENIILHRECAERGQYKRPDRIGG